MIQADNWYAVHKKNPCIFYITCNSELPSATVTAEKQHMVKKTVSVLII